MEKEKEKWIEDIEGEKYEKESVEFIFLQSDKLLQETIFSIRQTITKSHALLAFYIGVIVYWLDKYIETKYNDHYLILIIFGGLLSILILIPNITEQIMRLSGSQPCHLICDYYTKIEEKERVNQFKIGKIIDNQQGITNNINTNKSLLKRMKKSLLAILIMIIIYILLIAIRTYICSS